MRPSRWTWVLAAAALVSGCGTAPAAKPEAVTTASGVTPSATSSATSNAAPSVRPSVGPSAAPTPRPTRSASHPPARPTSPVSHLVGVGPATQVISVIAAGYGSSYATVTAYERSRSGWRRVLGPWPARIGRNGFAPPGAKREGDGRTPTGSYGFSFFFGVNTAPSGIHYSWRHAYSYDVWADDSASPRYNLWTDTRTQSAGRNPEPMHQVPAYDYAAVIAYNTARKPGLGSAIFFHVSHDSATAGCVSVPAADVVAVLRWLDPRRAPRIIMGTRAAVTR